MPGVEVRARQSRGASSAAVYRLVASVLRERHSGGGTLLDVGCGTGNLWAYLHGLYDRYVGADVLRYAGFPADAEFHLVDLDAQRLRLPDGMTDTAVAVETIEHLENPRAFFRELVRLTRPGGLVVVTTPNQLSLLSKLTLLVKNQFNAFQDGCYPAHLTALLETDLVRIARECGLADGDTRFSGSGRIPGTPWHWPGCLGFRGRPFSDNVLLVARKPDVW
jgi:2-polyprenyl-3-methyl-5-hydroxy-6-metoxy-1,4-benzoquinol methylase